MKRSVFVVGLALAANALLGCAGNRGGGDNEEGTRVGTLSLPLATQGASGVTYRLRDATFTILKDGAWGGYGGGSFGGGGGAGGAGPNPVITVSSETDPNAQSISVNVEEGYYFIQLQPGWHMEKLEASAAAAVEATLLNGEGQWVWVSRQSTSWVEYQFGIGGREIWLNGDLNIDIRVYEDPSELYGYGGSGGAGGSFTGGSFTGGAGGGAP